MPDISDKFELFAEVINKTADKECKKIEKKTEKLKKDETAKITKKIEEEYELMFLHQKEVFGSQINKKISEITLQNKNRVISHRTKIENTVFEDVKKKLFDFMKTKEYEDFLKKSAGEIIVRASGENVELFCREKDLPLVNKICESLSQVKSVSSDFEIEIGGLKARSENGALSLDDTLDSRLLLFRDYFKEYSKLIIEETEVIKDE